MDVPVFMARDLLSDLPAVRGGNRLALRADPDDRGNGGFVIAMARGTRVVNDRQTELKERLSSRDLTPETFVEMALTESDVQRVDIFKYSGGSNIPSKIDDFKPGTDPEKVTDYILDRHGPGRYRLSPVFGGAYLAHKTWAVGDFAESKIPSVAVEGAALDGRAAADRVSRDLADTLKTTTMFKAAESFIDGSEARAADREMRPATLMMEMVKSQMGMMKEMAARPAGPDTAATLLPLVFEMMQSNQTMMLELFKDKRDPAGGLHGLSTALQALETTLTGKIGQLLGDKTAAPAVDWVSVATVASPLLERTLGVIEAAFAPRQASRDDATSASRVEVPVAIAAPSPSPGGAPVKLHPDPEVDRALHEAASLAVEALKTGDYASVGAVLELNFPEFLDKINFHVNPLVYVQWLKRLDAGFAPLASEFSRFLFWLESQQEHDEGADRAAGAGPGEVAAADDGPASASETPAGRPLTYRTSNTGER